MVLPIPGRFPKEGREACLWHTILLARSSVLYLLLRPNKAIRSCGRACAVTLTDDLVPPFPNETRFAGLSFGEGVGSECGMQWSMSFRQNKRYIKNSNKLSFFIFDAVFLAPHGATEKHGNISCGKDYRMKYASLPSRRSVVSKKDAFKMIARFCFFARSAFKMKACSPVLPIKPNG